MKIYRDIILIISIDIGDLEVIRVNTLIATTFIKFLYLVKCEVYILDSGFQKAYSSDFFLFQSLLDEEGTRVIQPVIFIILVIIENYLNKMVLNLGRGTWVKRIDIDLPTWLKIAVARVENPFYT